MKASSFMRPAIRAVSTTPKPAREPASEPTIVDDGGELPFVRRLQQQIDDAFSGFASPTISTSAYLLRETLENISQGVIMFDAAHRMRIWNQRALDLLDLPESLARTQPTIDDIIEHQIANGEFDIDGLANIQSLRSADHARLGSIIERQRPNGRILKIATIPLQAGGFVRTFTDVTESRQQQAKIANAEKEFRQLIENATIGIYRTAVTGEIVWSNPTLVKLNGFESEQELIDSVVTDAGEWYVEPGRYETFMKEVISKGRITNFESEVILSKTGRRIWISEDAWLVRNEKGEPAYFEGTIIDITDRKKSEERLRHLASHDALTDLSNRYAFERHLNELLGAGKPVAVIILDLDGFKAINDQLGHEAGDVVLKTTARRMKTVWGRNSLAARFGGDEFAMLIEGGMLSANIGAVASELVNAIGEPIKLGRRTASVGVSIGIALAPRDGSSAAELIRRADNALYAAKSGGKNTYRFFDPTMIMEWQAHADLARDLRAAIRNDKLHVAYQPIIRVKTGEIASREALIRWRDPQRGLVSPGEFVPLAEKHGLIHQLDRYVLEKVCGEVARMPGNIPIAINISATEFASGDFYQTVRAALLSSGLPGDRLEIEITESAVLNDSLNTAKTMAQLRSLGIRLALDDFGAGYSALINLKKYAFDKIKIDQYFLRNSAFNATDIAILRAMIGLGNEIGVPVVVEGVETQEHHELLVQLDCPLAQGFLYGRPQPIG